MHFPLPGNLNEETMNNGSTSQVIIGRELWDPPNYGRAGLDLGSASRILWWNYVLFITEY